MISKFFIVLREGILFLWSIRKKRTIEGRCFWWKRIRFPFSIDYLVWRFSTVYSQPGKEKGELPLAGETPGKNRFWLHWRRFPKDGWNFLLWRYRMRHLKRYK